MKGYFLGAKDATMSFLDYVFFAIGLLLLPATVILLLGVIFFVVWIAVGYFLLLSLVHPKSAEKVIKEIKNRENE